MSLPDRLVEKFASYHRQSYACKVGVGDVLIGAAQTIAEYNGAAKASHVKDKIIEMNHLNETLYCGCIACASEGHKEPSGTYCVDSLLANVHKQNVTRFPYEIARLAQDIAGGLMVTLPSEADLRSPEVGKWIEKYCRSVEGVPVEDRMRILRLIENITLGIGRRGIPHGVDARRRLPAGATNHDFPFGRSEGKATESQKALRRHHG